MATEKQTSHVVTEPKKSGEKIQIKLRGVDTDKVLTSLKNIGNGVPSDSKATNQGQPQVVYDPFTFKNGVITRTHISRNIKAVEELSQSLEIERAALTQKYNKLQSQDPKYAEKEDSRLQGKYAREYSEELNKKFLALYPIDGFAISLENLNLEENEKLSSNDLASLLDLFVFELNTK